MSVRTLQVGSSDASREGGGLFYTAIAVGAACMLLLQCVAGAQTIVETDARTASSTDARNDAGVQQGSIRPFHYTASEEELVDLRRRVAATRWPEKETVSDATQGVQLRIQEERTLS
jgi:hypothetical protein